MAGGEGPGSGVRGPGRHPAPAPVQKHRRDKPKKTGEQVPPEAAGRDHTDLRIENRKRQIRAQQATPLH